LLPRFQKTGDLGPCFLLLLVDDKKKMLYNRNSNLKLVTLPGEYTVKKIDFGTVAILAMIAFVFLSWSGLVKDFVDHRSDTKKKEVLWSVEGEVNSLVTTKLSGKMADVSSQLAKVIETNPHRVLVPLVITHAQLWPHIDEREVERIIGLSRTNSGQAVSELEDILAREVSEAGARLKQDSSESELRSWYSSNAATRILFIDFPLAQFLGKEREFLKQELEWQLDGSPQWFAPDLTLKQYYDARK